MISFILGLICAVLALVIRALYKTYTHVPVKELKRLARSGDEVAVLLYRPVAYGISLRLMLSLLIILSGIGSFLLFAISVGTVLAVLVVLFLAVLGQFAIVPSGDLTKRSLWLAKKAAPSLGWLLERLNPVFSFIGRFIKRHRPVRLHTGLYEKADLAELLEIQKKQPDNRISLGEIDLLQHALLFGDKLVADVLIPKRVVKLVAASEPVGPILMADLHLSGHSRFPVFEGKQDNVIGVLYLHDLVAAKQTGTVTDVMKSHLTYVHEDFTLYQTLQAFLKTKKHLFLVVNSFEEFVGIITIEDIIEQIIGKQIVDEFDRYDDLRAVAAEAAKKEHTAHEKSKSEPKSDAVPTTGAPEVVQ
jgi:CBS domain containing-hemolysin-like protein